MPADYSYQCMAIFVQNNLFLCIYSKIESMSDDNERQINEKYELRIKKLDSKVIRLSQEKDDLKLQYEV
jgi:hypothetical protein